MNGEVQPFSGIVSNRAQNPRCSKTHHPTRVWNPANQCHCDFNTRRLSLRTILPLCKQMFLTKEDPDLRTTVGIRLLNIFHCLVLPCRLSLPGPITGRVEFVLSLCVSLAVTPGLILMLKYFSFANDVARLQSASLNMYGCRVQRTGCMEMQILRCRFCSRSRLHYG